jgi:ubiquinone/menaquinone biosynthesis C-methylase UbiE
MSVRTFLEGKINEEILLYYKTDKKVERSRVDSIVTRWSDDSLFSEKRRFDDLLHYLPSCNQKRVLDMSSGCGSFVIQGLLNKWNVFGVEPEQWKQDLIDLKFKENNYAQEWRSHILQGIGEDLPFEDNSFGSFNSWQTFEHVQDVSKCLTELYRVLEADGKGIIHCPSYMTFFEGHYRLFWFPMMGNSGFAKAYLKLRGRPAAGLRTFVPIKRSSLTRKAINAGFKVENVTKKELYSAAKRKFSFLDGPVGKLGLPLLYRGWAMMKALKRFGRNEKSIHLLLTK